MADQPDFLYNTVIQVSVDLLLHDPDNPRLPSKVKFKDDDGDGGEIIQWMLRDASILELMGAIAQVGFFAGEPLLVVACDPQKLDGPYYVIEGNRRLTAVKLLLNPNSARVYKELVAELSANAIDKDKLRTLPVIVYRERREILDYLGYRHVTGIKEWGPHEKTEYLYQLTNSLPYSDMDVATRHQAMARAIGSKAEYVARLLTARELFKVADAEHLLDDDGMSRAQDSFTYLTTALYYKSISAYININPKDVSLDGLDMPKYNNLLGWLYRKSTDGKSVVGDTRNLKLLNAIASNPDAIQNLEEYNDLTLAYQMATAKDPADNFRKQLSRIDFDIQTAIGLTATVKGLTNAEVNTADRIGDQTSILKKRIKDSIDS